MTNNIIEAIRGGNFIAFKEDVCDKYTVIVTKYFSVVCYEAHVTSEGKQFYYYVVPTIQLGNSLYVVNVRQCHSDNMISFIASTKKEALSHLIELVKLNYNISDQLNNGYWYFNIMNPDFQDDVDYDFRYFSSDSVIPSNVLIVTNDPVMLRKTYSFNYTIVANINNELAALGCRVTDNAVVEDPGVCKFVTAIKVDDTFELDALSGWLNL